MKRECGWCGKFLEEICPECGQPAKPLERAVGLRSWLARKLLRLPKNVHFCGNFSGDCSTLLFSAGMGKKTHGICPQCREDALKRERENEDRFTAAAFEKKGGPVQ